MTTSLATCCLPWDWGGQYNLVLSPGPVKTKYISHIQNTCVFSSCSPSPLIECSNCKSSRNFKFQQVFLQFELKMIVNLRRESAKIKILSKAFCQWPKFGFFIPSLRSALNKSWKLSLWLNRWVGDQSELNLYIYMFNVFLTLFQIVQNVF